jgi:hypothetical protein
MQDDDRRIRALQGRIALLEGRAITDQTRREIDWLDAEDLDRGIRNFPRAKYASIVQKQTTALTNLGKTHGVPLESTPLNLAEILHWFHGYIAKYGRRCNGRAEVAEDDELDNRKKRLDLETLEIKFKMLQSDLEKKTGNAVSADEVERLFVWFEGELRKLGERLGKRFGADAQNLFNSTLDRIGKHLEELMPGDNPQ